MMIMSLDLDMFLRICFQITGQGTPQANVFTIAHNMYRELFFLLVVMIYGKVACGMS